MTKIEQLRAALNGDPLDRGYSLTLDEAKQLLDLVEMQHEALKEFYDAAPEAAILCGAADALATFEEWNKP